MAVVTAEQDAAKEERNTAEEDIGALELDRDDLEMRVVVLQGQVNDANRERDQANGRETAARREADGVTDRLEFMTLERDQERALQVTAERERTEAVVRQTNAEKESDAAAAP